MSSILEGFAIENEGYRPVINEFNLHIGAENSCFNTEPGIAELLNKSLKKRLADSAGAAFDHDGRLPFFASVRRAVN